MAGKDPQTVIIADDDSDVLSLLGAHVRRWGYEVTGVMSKGELLSALVQTRPLLVLLDLRFGDSDGLELLQQILASSPDLPVAMLTAHGSIAAAVSAMQAGAYDFLTKPLDFTRLRVLLAHALEKQALAARLRSLEALAVSPGLRLLGESAAMRQTLDRLRGVAPTDATVLVLGESGTGKELAARTVHDLSRRKDGPFIPLNTAALPRELAESLLFGHERGAFTGADRAQAGVCELADKGTLFLDEIGEMELGLQAKLLRFLQERTLQRVGGARPISVDVRVVAATNRDLAERVRAGAFREDLYYRLNVVPVRMPALRERVEDIPVLAGRFLAAAQAKYGKTGMSFAPETLVAMQRYPWPGNVRQMENLVERLTILHPGSEIGPEAVADDLRPLTGEPLSPVGAVQPPIRRSVVEASGPQEDMRVVDQIERNAITDALASSKGKVREAAQFLGLSQATMYRKLKRYGINLEDFNPSAGGTPPPSRVDV